MDTKRLIASLAIASSATLGLTQAHAGEASTSFNVLLTLTPACNISTANDINFGTVDINSSDKVGSTAVSVTCPFGMAYNVGLTPANSNSAGEGEMLNPTAPAARMHYHLYKDSGYSNVWGNQIGTNTTPGTGTGDVQSFNIYAKVLSTEFNKEPGNYSDVVAIKVTY